jgi:DDHD domain
MVVQLSALLHCSIQCGHQLIKAHNMVLLFVYMACIQVDYQLQESPLQSANPYLAAISSHACYLFDDDFALFLLVSCHYNTLHCIVIQANISLFSLSTALATAADVHM